MPERKYATKEEEYAAHRRGNRLAEVIVCLAFITLIFAITIIVVLTEDVVGENGVCYLSTNSVDVCRYGYAVCIISFLVSIVTLFALCRPPVAIGFLSAFGTVWWLAYAITASVYANAASDAGYPQGHWRSVVLGLSWANFVCWLGALGLAAHLYRAAWKPEELGKSSVEEYGAYREFVARQDAEAAANASGVVASHV